MMFGSEPKRRFHKPWLMIATVCGYWCSSSARNARPSNGWTPSTEKKPTVTPARGTRSGSAPSAPNWAEPGTIRAKVGDAGPVGGAAGEEIGLLRPIGKVEIRDVAVGDARRRIFAFDVDDALGVRKRKRTEKNAVHQAEDGGVRANAESERDHGYGRKAFVLKQHPESVANVLKKSVHSLGQTRTIAQQPSCSGPNLRI